MLWVIFSILTALIIVSVITDIETTLKYEEGGLSKRTAILALVLVALGVCRELIMAIDPLV